MPSIPKFVCLSKATAITEEAMFEAYLPYTYRSSHYGGSGSFIWKATVHIFADE